MKFRDFFGTSVLIFFGNRYKLALFADLELELTDISNLQLSATSINISAPSKSNIRMSEKKSNTYESAFAAANLTNPFSSASNEFGVRLYNTLALQDSMFWFIFGWANKLNR